MSDRPNPIISADDFCPICRSAITSPGEPFGTWDGALGDGSGNWFSKTCDACGSPLVGMQYRNLEDSVVRIRWEGKKKPQ